MTAYLGLSILVMDSEIVVDSRTVEIYSYPGACEASDPWCIDHFPSIIDVVMNQELDKEYILDNFEANLIEMGICNEDTGEINQGYKLDSVTYDSDNPSQIDNDAGGDSTEFAVELIFLKKV